MAIGYAASQSVAGLNNQLGQVAVQQALGAALAVKLWEYVESLGANETDQVAALAALSGWGDPSADPQAYWAAANYAYAQAQLYYGQITQPSEFNYDTAQAPARGGQ